MKKISTFLVLFLIVMLAYNNPIITFEKSQKGSDSLVAYFPFNGNANDESGNGHNGTVYGARITTDRYNLAGQAYDFKYDGYYSDNIELPGTSDYNFSTTGFTLSAWVKFSGEAGAGNNYPIIAKHICGEQSGYILMLYNSKLTFWLAGSGGYNVVGTPDDYTDNSWHQVTAVYDGINQYIYVDGGLKNSIVFNYAVFNTANLSLGGYNGCNGGFNGKVDEVKIFNLPLTAAEIMSEYNQSKIKLVAYFPFNGNANDETGNGSNPTYIGIGVTLTSDRFGNPDKAYCFDGNAGSYIRMPADRFPTTDRTISFWFNADKVENHPTPLSYGGDVCHNSVLMIINKGDYPNAYTFLSHCASNFISAPYSEDPVNEWYYLTMTIRGSTQKIFINGELKQTANTFGTPTVVTGKSAILGAILFTDGVTVYNEPTAGNFKGKMDDFRFYDLAMTDSEVENLFINESEGLVVEYPFNGNAEDVTGNQNNGFVHNAVLTTDRYGEAEKSYLFNGTNSYIEGMSPGNNLPTGNSPRTFAAWIKNYSYHQWGSNIFHYGTMEAAPTNFHFLITDVLGLGNGYGYGVTYGKTNLVDSTWHFVCGTYSNTDQNVKLYIDGKFDNSAILPTTPNTVLYTPWRIGLFLAGGTPFNGKLDEIKVYSTDLTDQEIKNIYLSETTAPTLQLPSNEGTINTLTPTMQWSSSFANAKFRFQLADDLLFTSILQDDSTMHLETQISEGMLADGINYYWRVRTTLNGETGPWSDVWKFSPLNTGLNQQHQANDLLFITPNPAGALVEISYTVPGTSSGKSPVKLEILNSLGSGSLKILEKNMAPGTYKTSFGTENLKPGIYYCRMKTINQMVVRKLVITR
jgi:hypothetical protein